MPCSASQAIHALTAVTGHSAGFECTALMLTPPAGVETHGAEFGPMVRRVKAMLRHWEHVAQRPHLPSLAFDLLCLHLLNALGRRTAGRRAPRGLAGRRRGAVRGPGGVHRPRRSGPRAPVD